MRNCRLGFFRSEEEICSYIAGKTETMLERMRGLLFASPLLPDAAMMITPCNSVHSYFMRYAIDVLYVDKQHQVCHIVSGMKPWRTSIFFPASYVVELVAGEINKYGIRIGDKCECSEI